MNDLLLFYLRKMQAIKTTGMGKHLLTCDKHPTECQTCRVFQVDCEREWEQLQEKSREQ